MKNTDKFSIRLAIGTSLFFLSIIGVVITILINHYYGYRLIIWIGLSISLVLFILFVIVMPKTNRDGTPIVINKKKKSWYKTKKVKKPFISDKEWKKLDEEDDETMFIEEVVEDDK